MFVKEIMTPNPQCASPDTPIDQIAQQMEQLGVGAIPVVDGSELCGIITDRDITTRVVARGSNPRQVRCGEAMTADVQCINEDDEIDAAAELMKSRKIRRVVVLDGDQHVCGVVSLGDLACKGEQPQKTEEALEEISTPAAPLW